MSDLCDLTKRIWYSYVLGDEDEELKDMEDIYVPDCVIIGTGKHEIYTGLAQFKTALQQEMAERQAVRVSAKGLLVRGKEDHAGNKLCIWRYLYLVGK